jgi:hypothetical protein
MRIQIIKNTKIDGVYTPASKKVIDVAESDARTLIYLKRAVPAEKPAPQPSQGAVKGKPTETNVPASEEQAGKESKND